MCLIMRYLEEEKEKEKEEILVHVVGKSVHAVIRYNESADRNCFIVVHSWQHNNCHTHYMCTDSIL